MKINFKEEYFKGKSANLKEKVGKKLSDTKDWMIENKELVILVAPTVIGGVTKLTKMEHKHYTLNKAEELKELYCYDRSLGHYWQLKRKLTNKEWVTVDRRKQNGERLADILESLKVLI